MLETKEVLNIGRKLYNLGLISSKVRLEKKEWVDIHEIEGYLKHSLRLNLDNINIIELTKN